MKELLLKTSPISFLEGKLRQYSIATKQAELVAKTTGMPDKSNTLLYKTLPALNEHAAQIRETVDRRLSQRQQQLAPWLAQNPKGPYRLIDVSEALGYKGHPDTSVSRVIRQAAAGMGLDGNTKFLKIPNGRSVVKLCEDYAILKEQDKRFRERKKSRLAAAQASPTQTKSAAETLKSAIAGLSEESKRILVGPTLQKIRTRFGILEANSTFTFSFFCNNHGPNSVTTAIPAECLQKWAKFVDLQPSGICNPTCYKVLIGFDRFTPPK